MSRCRVAHGQGEPRQGREGGLGHVRDYRVQALRQMNNVAMYPGNEMGAEDLFTLSVKSHKNGVTGAEFKPVVPLIQLVTAPRAT